MGGAKGLKLDRSHRLAERQARMPTSSSSTPTALNVAPLNNAVGAVVTLMDRSNVSTVLCAGDVKKWRGALVGYDVAKLRAELTASRDYVFAAAGIEQNLFRA